MTRNKTIGERIAAVRAQHHESQDILAAALGVKRQVVGYWETGERPIKTEMLAEIAARYGVSADYLLGLSEASTTEPELKAVCDFIGLSEDAVKALQRITRSRAAGSEEMITVNDYIAQALPRVLDALDLIGIKTGIAASNIWYDKNPDYELLQELEEGIQVSLYRYAKLCESIPDAIDLGVQEIMDDIWKAMHSTAEAADNGND